MASIFKRDKKKNSVWWLQYLDQDGKRRTVKGFTDKSITEQLAARLEGAARMRQSGLIDADQERYACAKLTPIDILLAAFQESLTDNTDKHLKLTLTRVRRIVSGCGFTCLGEIEAEKVRRWLSEYRKTEDLGHRTFNHYLQAMDAFCNWCVQSKRLIANPLVGMDRLNTEVDVRHQRRALSPEEFVKLVDSARSSAELIQCYDGETRSRIYILSYMTGLRRLELASLTPRSFQLDVNPPTIVVEAACSKHRRKDVLPLHPDLVVLLRSWLPNITPDELLFPKLARRRTWLMVKKDLERVGIAYETPEGIADFHAAGRHTHITELLRNGASLPEARELARHSDVKMTMKYVHIGIEDQSQALKSLPTSALQMRCISGGSDRLSVSADVSLPTVIKRRNPCGGKGFDVDRRQLAKTGNLEAAGVAFSRLF